jgi:hypothetical protein
MYTHHLLVYVLTGFACLGCCASRATASGHSRVATCVTGPAKQLELTNEIDRVRVSIHARGEELRDVFVAIKLEDDAPRCETKDNTTPCNMLDRLAGIVREMHPVAYRCSLLARISRGAASSSSHPLRVILREELLSKFESIYI